VIAIADYGAGNLTSVRKAFRAVGADVRVVREARDLGSPSAIVVPGVGHFAATSALDEGWREAILRHVNAGRPLLGICLGMQWLFESSDEAPGCAGLGLLAGACTRLRPPADGPRLKVPHVGWNQFERVRPSAALDGIADGAHAYYTHSYAAPVTGDTVALTTHGQPFAAAVERGAVWGIQFHPEKSSEVGLAILGNFLRRSRGDSPEPQAARPGQDTRRALPAAAIAKRIIACLDVRDGSVVKGVRFEQLRQAGDPAELARRYNREGIDELVILDVTATIESRRAIEATIRAAAAELFIPLAVGGGIRSVDDAAAIVEAGADKVSVNTAALRDPDIITTIAGRFGSQAVVVAVDAARRGGGFAVYARSAQEDAGRDAVAWAREAESRGAGEILLTSIDRDGTREGFDCELTAAVSDAVSIPVIASGGAGTFDHFTDVFTRGRADAALAASIFHYRESAVRDLKRHLAAGGIPVRC
jgi:imidazole glycerol-phosphate synthase subunit HisF